jgi:hypothetical protein
MSDIETAELPTELHPHEVKPLALPDEERQHEKIIDELLCNLASVEQTAADANGIQQQFDTAKFSACGLHPTGQTAYSEGFIAGCTQAGNTQQMCMAFIQLNTGAQSTTQTQPPTTTQPTQAIPPTG